MALQADRDALMAFEKTKRLDECVLSVLGHHLQALEADLLAYEDFGDTIFWKNYKYTFSTFLQVHGGILPEEVRDEVKHELNEMYGKLSLGLRMFGVVGGAASIAGITLPLLTG